MSLPAIAATLGNRKWLQRHEADLKKLLPDVWTHAENLGQDGMLRIGFGLKLLGVDWSSEKEFGGVMVLLEKLGIMLRQNEYQIMANPTKLYT